MTVRNFVNKYQGFGRNFCLHLQVKIQLFYLRLKAVIACETLVPVYQKHHVTTQNIFIFTVKTVRTLTSHRPAQKQTTFAGLNMFPIARLFRTPSLIIRNYITSSVQTAISNKLVWRYVSETMNQQWGDHVCLFSLFFYTTDDVKYWK